MNSKTNKDARIAVRKAVPDAVSDVVIVDVRPVFWWAVRTATRRPTEGAFGASLHAVNDADLPSLDKFLKECGE
jgi:hypothetical protein